MNCPDDTTQSVLLEVRYERQRQTEKWGIESHPDGIGNQLSIIGSPTECMKQAQQDCDLAGRDGTISFWHILFEEVLEANAAHDKENLREELIQIAAAAVAWAEKIDRDLSKQ